MSWNYYNKIVPFETLNGKTLVSCEQDGAEIEFKCQSGEIYRLLHQQDCCESVYIESIEGQLSDLIGSEILKSDEKVEDRGMDEWGETDIWSFYTLATVKGYVDIRFVGSSNGYYSEAVDLIWINKPEKEKP